MSLEWIIYFANTVDKVIFVGILLAIVSTVLGAVGFFLKDDKYCSEVDRKNSALLFRLFIPLAFMSLVTVTFAPSSKTIYTILGVSASKKIVKEIGESERFNKVLQIIDIKLDKMIEKN